MLVILFLFFIGHYFFKLAEKYKRNKWAFGLLGVATYYVGTIIFAVGYGIIYFSINPEATEESIDELSVGLLSIPFGLVSCYILHYILKKNWKKVNEQQEKNNIEDIGSN